MAAGAMCEPNSRDGSEFEEVGKLHATVVTFECAMLRNFGCQKRHGDGHWLTSGLRLRANGGGTGLLLKVLGSSWAMSVLLVVVACAGIAPGP
jgi:hypothetical protein